MLIPTITFFIALGVLVLMLWLSTFVAVIAKILWVFILIVVIFGLYLLVRMIQELRKK